MFIDIRRRTRRRICELYINYRHGLYALLFSCIHQLFILIVKSEYLPVVSIWGNQFGQYKTCQWSFFCLKLPPTAHLSADLLQRSILIKNVLISTLVWKSTAIIRRIAWDHPISRPDSRYRCVEIAFDNMPRPLCSMPASFIVINNYLETSSQTQQCSTRPLPP